MDGEAVNAAKEKFKAKNSERPFAPEVDRWDTATFFAANEAYFHILLFSYNLINWFKRLCLPKDVQNVTLNTLRSRLLLIPGVLVKSENRPTLKLPANFWYRDTFEYAVKKIARLKI